MALFTGNLASISAWWIWPFVLVSMVAFGLVPKFGKNTQRFPGPLAQITILCALAGVASRTIIDKYIMVFSGLVCIGIAAIWIGLGRSRERTWPRRCTRIAAVSLALVWVGCYVNLVTERHWASLRWLDPWERALAELEGKVATTQCVVSQPAARYYYGVMMARSVEPTGSIHPDLWRRFAMPPGIKSSVEGAATPDSMLESLKSFLPLRVATIRGAEFADSPEWSRLQAILDREYRVEDERTYLRDPDAKWKDKLDPTFKHPEWRITVRVYVRRLENEPIACAAGSSPPPASPRSNTRRGGRM
jgi:hypothetical protein